MTLFLGASWVDGRFLALTLGVDPVESLKYRGGRASPIYHVGGPQVTTLPETGCIGILFPRSPRDTFFRILEDEALLSHSSVYMTHGLASVLIISAIERRGLSRALENDSLDLAAYEIWPLTNTIVDSHEIVIERFHNDFPTAPHRVQHNDLPQTIGVEVRQFNANLALLTTTAHEFAPELLPLCDWLAESVERRVLRIRDELREERTFEMAKRLHHEVSILVDVNSCLTMVLSQVADVQPPVANSSFPVGENSLLGVGSATRAIWHVYQHISHVFERADHPNRLQNAFQAIGFDPGMDYREADFDTWRHAGTRVLSTSPLEGGTLARKHLVYFSSRWGFHETLNAISLSWQTINSGATREWNLLTLSHEFLHSHFRELIRANVLDITSDEDRDRLVALYNSAWNSVYGDSEKGKSTKPALDFVQSMQVFFVNQLQWVIQADRAVTALSDAASSVDSITEPISSAELSHLLAAPLLDFVEEVMVHTMDFHYFYNADDSAYISSLWHSWSLVPQVHRKLRHYLLRTLLALASTENRARAEEAFESTVARLRHELQGLATNQGSALVEAGIDELNTLSAKKQLFVRFKYSFHLVQFTRFVLIDDGIYAALNKDDQSTIGPAPKYRLEVGEFPEWVIESPTGFLLDRFATVVESDERDTEAESLWQLLVLI